MKSRKLLTKIVTVVLFSLLILSFAVWGIGDIFRGGTQARIVAKVGDVEIDQQRFSTELSRQINQLSRRFGTQLDAEQARALGVVQQVLSQSISRALFDQQANDLRMLVSPDAVKAQLMREDVFKDQFGSFSRDQFIRVLQISNMSEGAFLNSLRRDMQRDQLVGAVTDAVAAPRALSNALHAYENEKRVAEYLIFAPPGIEEIGEPGSSDLQTYYDDNKQSFMAPEYRGISLVQLRTADVVSESAIDAEAVRAEFETRRDELTVPERRSLEQIVFADLAAAKAASERLAAGEDFVVLAKELTGAEPISLGTVPQTLLLPELAGPAFAQEAGVPGAPVQGPIQWHIIRVTEVLPGREPDFEEVRADLAADIAKRQAVDSLISIANQFDDELAGGANLDESAASLGLTIRRIEAIDFDGQDKQGAAVADLPELREFAPVLQNTQVGETSLLTETGDGGYFILRVDDVQVAAARPLDEVREEISKGWRQAEALKQASGKAEALLEQLLRSGDLATLAAEQNMEVKTTAAITRFESDPEKTPAPQLASQLFQIGIGETTSLAADSGHIIASLKQIIPADLQAEADELANTQKNLGQAMQNDLLEQYLAALRQEYGVTVNDAVVDEIISSF